MAELFAGRYELIDQLGQGGMGTVWRAWDQRGGRGAGPGGDRPPGFVAVKLLQRGDAVSLMRFVREQAFRIEHPNVVTPFSWAAEDDRVLFAMPLVAGGSLATLRADFGVLPPVWVGILLDQLLAGLQAVHAARVVHRDLKPANLLLEPSGRGRPHLRLSDFGIAAAIGEPRLTATSNVIGTPGYLAPEQLRGAAPDPQQDLYASGVLAAELLLGRHEEKSALPEVSGPTPPGVPESMWTFLLRLAANEPADRPPNAGAARAELAATGWVPGPGDPFPPPSDEPGIEVFNHLPPLPEGWTPIGGPARQVGPAPIAKRPTAQPGQPLSPGPGTTRPVPVAGSTLPYGAAATTPAAAEPPVGAPAPLRAAGRGRVGRIAAIAAIVAMAGGAVMMAWAALLLLG